VLILKPLNGEERKLTVHGSVFDVNVQLKTPKLDFGVVCVGVQEKQFILI
jgi:hypothetical protein